MAENSAIKIFNNPQFGEISTIEVNNEPFFIGSEIAYILGYSNPQKAIRDHVDEDEKLTERIVLSGQNREVILINESGLYSLVFGSKLLRQNTQNMKIWVDWIFNNPIFATIDQRDRPSCWLFTVACWINRIARWKGPSGFFFLTLAGHNFTWKHLCEKPNNYIFVLRSKWSYSNIHVLLVSFSFRSMDSELFSKPGGRNFHGALWFLKVARKKLCGASLVQEGKIKNATTNKSSGCVSSKCPEQDSNLHKLTLTSPWN